MQLKSLFLVALLAALAVANFWDDQDQDQDDLVDDPGQDGLSHDQDRDDFFDDIGDRVQSLGAVAIQKGDSFWSSIASEASKVAYSYSTKYTRFTATASAGPRAASHVASLKSAAAAKISSLQRKIATATATATVTVTAVPIPAATVASTTRSTGAAAALPTGNLGAVLLGGAAAWAAAAL